MITLRRDHVGRLAVVMASVTTLVVSGAPDLVGLARTQPEAAAAAGDPQLQLPASPIVPSTDGVGYLGGSWGVSAAGALTYSIPLDVPAGRASVAPQLSLQYTSGGQDGHLGLGWSLAGATSMLTWCGSSLSTEGSTSGVRLDGTDRLCLDGQKLIAVSGEYGKSGTRYRTETESFAEIISGPAAGADGPANFTVRTKDGRIRFYEGHRTPRRSLAVALRTTGPVEVSTADSTPRTVWRLVSEQDRSDNLMRFEYDNIGGPGAPEIAIGRITYTHRGAEPAYRRVEFEYQSRPDTSFAFLAGVRHTMTRRLTAIRMFAPNPAATALVWRYDLGYIQSPLDRSLLSSVSKCAASGRCLRAKTFGWESSGQAPIPAFTPVDIGPAPVSLGSGSAPGMRIADLNGDGLHDAVYTLGGQTPAENSVRLRLGTRNAAGAAAMLAEHHDTAAVSGWPVTVNFPGSRPLDINADGVDEFMVKYPIGAGGLSQVLRWNGAQQRFDSTGTLFASPSPSNFADLNGDGLLDHVTADVPQSDDGSPQPPTDPEGPPPAEKNFLYSVQMNTGAGFAPPAASTLVASDRRSVVRTTELDGDGRAELMIGSYVARTNDAGALTGQLGSFAAGGDTFYRVPPLNGRVGSSWYQYEAVDGDFNGDGLTDWLLLPVTRGANNQWRYPAALLWNTGNGLSLDDTPVDIPHDEFADVQAADLNGDGRDDLVAFHSATTAMVSQGDGRFVTWHIAGSGGAKDPAAGRSTSQLGDFNGDGRLDVVRIVGDRLVVLAQSDTRGDRITTITDQGTQWAAQTVTYSTQWSDKPAAAACSYPQLCPRRGLTVVRRVDSRAELVDPADVTKPARSLHYSYEDLRVDLRGRGPLGFGRTVMWDPARPAEVVTTYDNQTRIDGRYYPNAGQPHTVTVTVPILNQAEVAQRPATATARVSRTSYNTEVRRPGGGPTYAVFPKDSLTKEWEQPVSLNWADSLATAAASTHISGVQEPFLASRSTVTTATFDDYGNQTFGRASTMFGVTEEVRTDFDNRAGDWLISLPTVRRVTRSEADGDPVAVTRTSEVGYDSRGRVDIIHTEKDSPDPDLRLTTDYELDDYGLIRSTTVTADGLAQRRGHVEYQPTFPGQPDEKVFASRMWSSHSNTAATPSVWTAVHPALGVTVATVDANGVRSRHWFDDHGRPTRTEQDGAATQDVSYANRADQAGGSNGTIVTATQAQRTSRVISDAIGRTLSTAANGFLGGLPTTTIGYDALGRATSQTEPAPGGTTRQSFDSLDRVLTSTTADNKTSTNTHTFGTTTTVDPTGARTETAFDLNSRVASITRYLAGQPGQRPVAVTTAYGYGPFDQLATVTDPRGNVTGYRYDRLGRRTQVSDPDRGTTTVTYHGTGDVDTETHAGTGHRASFGYDDLGRITSTTTEDGTSTFVFDTAANGIGKPAYSISTDQIRLDYRYDTHSRPEGVTYTDQATNTSYGSHQTYDQHGRPDTLTYPEGFAVKYSYNQQGHLLTINDVSTPQAPQQLWKVASRNPNNSLHSALLGPLSITNGYDSAGRPNKLTATSPNQGQNPSALAVDTPDAGPPGTEQKTVQELSYSYHDNGLVRSRTDAVNKRSETFSYDTLHRLTGWQLGAGSSPAVATGYHYSNIGTLEAVTRGGQVVEQRGHGRPDGTQPHTLTSVTPAGGPTQVNTYDPLGRQLTGNGRSTTYTAAHLPRTITANGQQSTYAYDATGQKAKESSPGRTTFYLPSLYERRLDGDTTTHVFHVSGPDGAIGQVTRRDGTTAVDYLLTDHIGSSTATSDSAGVIAQRLFYEPFGLPTDQTGAPDDSGLSSGLTRGFTGHEHSPAVGLINMNGRVYDPEHKAFLTPDAVGTAGTNPYSYVGNNPLNYTDPSGHTTQEIYRRWKDGQSQEAFEEFVAAGDAYHEGGTAGLAQHQLGALGRGTRSYNRAVDTEKAYAADANRRAAIADAVKMASAVGQALGLDRTPPSPFQQALAEGDALNKIATAMFDALRGTGLRDDGPDLRLASNDGYAPGQATRELQDRHVAAGQKAAVVVTAVIAASIYSAGRANAATRAVCAKWVSACLTLISAVVKFIDPSIPTPMGPSAAAAAVLDESISTLRPAEQATVARLATQAQFAGRRFLASPHVGADWVDDLGRSFDALGDGTKSQYFKAEDFTASIGHHLNKSNNYTVIDMTGYTQPQIDAVRTYVGGLAAEAQRKILRIGF